MFRTPTTSTARNGNGGSRRSLWTPTMTNRAPSPSRPSSANQQRGRSSNETQPSPTDTTSSMDGTGNGEVLSILRSLQQQVSVLQAQQGLRSNSESSNTTPQRETRDKEGNPSQEAAEGTSGKNSLLIYYAWADLFMISFTDRGS